MDSNGTNWTPLIASENSSLQWENNTGKIYVFMPVGFNAKLALCLILSVIGAVGFLGNTLLFCYLWKKKSRSRNPIQSSPFMINLKTYVRSLSLSDLLCCAVSLPLVCIQIFVDIFQSGWSCKIVRYLNLLFPAIAINNLVVISLEKYLSTRRVPRTFSFSTVRKMIIYAWVLGLVVTVFPSVGFGRKRLDLNNIHFTVVCGHDDNIFPLRTRFIHFAIQFVLPVIFVTYSNTCLLKTVWTAGRRKNGSGMNNAFKAHLRAQRIKGTIFLVARSFAFVFSYFLYFGNMVYTAIDKPQLDFSTLYLIRNYTAGVAYCSSVFNFLLYLRQMKEFRVFLKNKICRGSNVSNQPEVINGERIERAINRTFQE